MPTFNAINEGTQGVDMRVSPLTLETNRFASATNIRFEENRIRTRPGFNYANTGLTGQFQGAEIHTPSLGISKKSYGEDESSIAVAIGGKIHLIDSTCGDASCPKEVCGTDAADLAGKGDVHFETAENYLVATNPQSPTIWWDGEDCFECSPGFQGCGTGDECESSHDTFCKEKLQNWLPNSADHIEFVNGRLHVSAGCAIYVSDMLHKRGWGQNCDVLVMEEQATWSYGDPLGTNSKMGRLCALEVLPTMNTANGEGQLIGYYEGGVVAYDTFQFPRETRYSAKGELISEGWGTKRMVSHLLNTVSAVGRYAVAITPRDHFIRSRFGVHFLKSLIGEGSFNDETTNAISQDVEPVLQEDNPALLKGAATGHWLQGSRLFATTGLHERSAASSSAMGKGFVSFNQASTFSEDRTPRFLTEGVWSPDHGIEGIHRFLHTGLRSSTGGYGFLASDRQVGLHYAEIDSELEVDIRDGQNKQIEWNLETGYFAPSGLARDKEITEGRFEAILAAGSRVRVSIRTNEELCWQEWGEVECSKEVGFGEKLLVNHVFARAPKSARVGSWFQFRVEGIGWAEIKQLDVEYSEGDRRNVKSKCLAIGCCDADYHEINCSPAEGRWN